MDAAVGIVKTLEEDVLDRQQQLEAIAVDEKVMERADEIERLAQLCSLYANHSRDLPLRRAEMSQWLGEVLTRSVEFSWGSTEEEVRIRLPQEKVLRAIDTLLKQQGALLADERAAKDAEEERQAASDDVQDKLDALPEPVVDPQLAQALAHALPYKTSDSKQKNLQNTMTLAESAAKRAMTALGRSHLTQELLRSMQLPSLERVTAYRASRKKIDQAREVACSLAEQHRETAADLELQISQFVRSRKVVTAAEVSGARRERDEKWSAIKSGLAVLTDTAPQLDTAIRLADELVDARTLSETDGAELQALRDQLEKATEERGRYQQVAESKQRELKEFDARWADQASNMGLAGMELDDLPEWLARRETALQAMDILEDKKQDYERERDNAAQARDDLSKVMTKAGLVVNDSSGLAALCTVAEEHIRRVERTRTQYQALRQQLQTARSALKTAQKAKRAKTMAVEQWDSKWKETLSKAHLTGVGDDVAEVEAAVEAAGFIRQRLEKIDSHRSERIETMEADLEQLKETAEVLVHALAPDLKQSSPDELSRTLRARLEEAKRQSNRKTQALEFLDGAKRQLSEAKSTLELAKHSLEPLLTAAGVEEPLLALPLVERAQKKTEIQDSISDTKSELERASDGLKLEQIQAEVEDHPVADALAQLMMLQDNLDDSERRLTELVQAQLAAKQAFDAIDGGAQAAIAEAQKQEALADMSEASPLNH